MTRLTALVGTASATPDWEDVARTLLGDRTTLTDDSAAGWPFRRMVTPAAAPPGTTILLRDMGRAFPGGQAGSTRLVTTQSLYQLQRWLDWLDANPRVTVVADLSSASSDVEREIRARRGPWARVDIVEVRPIESRDLPAQPRHELVEAFQQPDAAARLEACRRAVEAAPKDAAILLALASALMEAQLLDQSLVALERAAEAASNWEAVHYELGKLWLRADDTDRAAAAFKESARLMPSFAAAHSNLGAALGELDRPLDALAALEHAARLDPHGHTVHNNLGATFRDLGRLDEAEASFRRVIQLAPAFVFGHYNLGHALFLQGRFADARKAYEDGLAMDPARTPQQLARLAMASAAAGDGQGACAHAREALDRAGDGRRQDIYEEMVETIEALRALQGPSDPIAMLERELAYSS
ncbi:MAG TPA: tetratricopeptide repeat protein [Vicinamibacterales bacterium]